MSARTALWREDVLSGDMDRLLDAVWEAIEKVEDYESSPRPWAICEGGLIQDSSPGVETIDLDWMESGAPHDLEEVERSWRLLDRLVNNEGHTGWANYLTEVTETLTSMYKDAGTDEKQKVWMD